MVNNLKKLSNLEYNSPITLKLNTEKSFKKHRFYSTIAIFSIVTAGFRFLASLEGTRLTLLLTSKEISDIICLILLAIAAICLIKKLFVHINAPTCKFDFLLGTISIKNLPRDEFTEKVIETKFSNVKSLDIIYKKDNTHAGENSLYFIDSKCRMEFSDRYDSIILFIDRAPKAVKKDEKEKLYQEYIEKINNIVNQFGKKIGCSNICIEAPPKKPSVPFSKFALYAIILYIAAAL